MSSLCAFWTGEQVSNPEGVWYVHANIEPGMTCTKDQVSGLWQFMVDGSFQSTTSSEKMIGIFPEGSKGASACHASLVSTQDKNYYSISAQPGRWRHDKASGKILLEYFAFLYKRSSLDSEGRSFDEVDSILKQEFVMEICPSKTEAGVIIPTCLKGTGKAWVAPFDRSADKIQWPEKPVSISQITGTKSA